MPELFPTIDTAMSMIKYNVAIQINLTHSVFKNDIIFVPERDEFTDRSTCQRTLNKVGKLVRRIPYLRSMSNRAILNGKFSQRFETDANVTWSADCFSAVTRPVGGVKTADAQQEASLACNSETAFGDTYECNLGSIPANHEVHCTFCYATELLARQPTDDGFKAELRIHLPVSSPESSPVHRKTRRSNEFANCLIFVDSKNVKTILARSSDGQDIPVEVGKRNNQTLILLPNQLFGKIESVSLLLEMENVTVLDRFMWNPEDIYSHPQTCPYCKELTSSCNAGLLKCNFLTFSDYQGLIDRGWARQGKYCFRPNLATSCCPTYTIRCKMKKFQISKSQKRVISKMNDFLARSNYYRKSVRNAPEKSSETTYEFPPNSGNKARRKRIQRRIEKGKTVQSGVLRDPPKSIEDRLSDGIKVETTFEAGTRKLLFSGKSHELEVAIVPVGSPEELASRTESFQIYQLYEFSVHGRGEGEGEENIWYERFVKHPFQINREEKPGRLTPGVYHCQYRLDGELIAVGVIEYLLDRIYSVYMYYKPQFGFLNLGTYSALIECYLARSSKIEWYYMGYYVHSCQKVQYKARFRPSEFCCPETYSWHTAERTFALFEKSKYARLAPASESDANQIDFEPRDLIHQTYLPPYIGFIHDDGNFIQSRFYETPEIAASIHRLCELVGQSLSRKLLQHRPNFYHI